jgi:hypothetical protein
VSIRYQLRPLTRDEVADYVSHRMKVAGAPASVVFQPRALDMVHRRTKGIPRLVNLVCYRSLLAAYAGRTNRVTADVVFQAAESLELADESPSSLGWLRRRASVYVAAAGASVSLAVGGGVMAWRSPAGAESAHAVSNAPEIKGAPATVPAPAQTSQQAAAPEDEPSDARYSVLTASFPIADLLREGSAAATRFNAVVGELRQLGYDVRSMDVTLRDRGEWRRVLVGEFATLSDAQAEVHRVHQTPAFANAQVIRY